MTHKKRITALGDFIADLVKEIECDSEESVPVKKKGV